MIVLRISMSRKFSSATATLTNGPVKVSPAAFWHAHFLGISLKGIKGTGPKGHILKSDILQLKKPTSSFSEDFSFLIEIASPPNDQVIKKCIESIKRLPMSQEVIKELNYKTLPEIGLLQFELKTGTKLDNTENIKNLLKIYLNDSSHLLL
jgi:pyruvate/2-oxoglutarate dehydrogenase complex dihydrolipoamide acyltransferase (E2) component